MLLKLVALTIGLVCTSLSFNLWQSSKIYEEIALDREQITQQQLTLSTAAELELTLQTLMDQISSFAQELANGSSHKNLAFERDVLYFEIEDLIKGSKYNRLNAKLLKDDTQLPQQTEQIEKIFQRHLSTLVTEKARLINGETLVMSSRGKFGSGHIIVGAPIGRTSEGITTIAWAILRAGYFQRSLQKEGLYLLDSQGVLIGAQEEKLLKKLTTFRDDPRAQDALGPNITRFQQRLVGDDLVSTVKADFGLSLISIVSHSYLVAPSRHARQMSLFIMGVIVSITFFIGLLFSLGLTSNIEKMVEMTKRVAKGEFEINAKSVIKSNDEMQLLAHALDDMSQGLKEREKIKTMFSKFHGESVTEALMKQEDLRKGFRKDVVVFFSDIRGFTSFSEGRSPEEIVEMLNEYFQVMVTIIQNNGGVVDKFVGDAIMAVWGAPVSHGDDAARALKACLEMRQGLAVLNESRMARGLPPVKMGMGLHAGPALSGSIGADTRMEFTVIGDTVNTASRIESATKAHGTDLLVSEEVRAMLADKFIFAASGETYAKGKTSALKLHKVHGVVVDGVETIIRTPWSESEVQEEGEKIKVG